ncbi:hypothetical protein Tco_0295004 [Tanacetum coccineum]
MSPENKAHFESEKEAIHLILTRIGDEIYSSVDACKTAHEMWEAIERLQQGESLNIQDVKTNLFWEFGKFTSHDGETMESYYTRFYKMMNEMIRNNLTVATMQVNIQFLQQLQPEWLMFVTIVKQQHKLDEVTYDKLFDSLKQYQKDVNEIRAERIAKNANPLALVATSQPHQDPYYQTSKSHKSSAPTSKTSLPTRSHATTRYKGKEIDKPIIPLSESASEEDSDPEQAQKDKEMQKNLALIAKTMTVAGARETVGGQVQYDAGYNVFANEIQHSEQPESISNTCVVEMGDSNVIPDSPNMCDNDIQNDQNVVECDDEHVALANLICKSILAETSKTLGESNSIQDSCIVALQNKQTEFERYKTLNDRTVDYEKLEHKLKETIGLLAQKDIDIKEGLKLKAYKILVFKEKHDELVKQSLLTMSHYEGLVKEKTQVITDLKLKEEKDIDKMISMEKQLKFLDKIVYKRNQLIQTIHMLAPKGPTFNGRPTFANLMYLERAQSEKPCLYEIPHDQSDPANRLVPNREDTLTLERDSRSKLNKDLVRPYDYTKLNSLYEIFKPPTQEYLVQLAHANERTCRQACVKHSKDHFRAPTAHDMEILIKTCLMPLALKTQNDSFAFFHELKQEMHADLKYVESVEKEVDELKSDKAEFLNMYDMLLQECVSNDLMCSYLHSLSNLDAHTELQCVYLHKVKECECLAQKLSKQTEFVSKEVYTALLQSFAKLEKHSISLELALQQHLEAQLEDKNIAICELKKLIEKCIGKSVETKFDKPFVVRQPNAQRIPKPLVLGKPDPFLDSLERKHFSKTNSVPITNVSEGLSKIVTTQNLPQTVRQAVRNTKVIKPGMYQIDTRTTKTRAPQLPQTSRNTNPRMSTST